MSPTLRKYAAKKSARDTRAAQADRIAELEAEVKRAKKAEQAQLANAVAARSECDNLRAELDAAKRKAEEESESRMEAECDLQSAGVDIDDGLREAVAIAIRERDAAKRKAEVRGAGCQCSDDDACQFARERDAARAENERLKTAIQAFMEDAQVEEDGPYYEIIVGQIEFNVLRERGGK